MGRQRPKTDDELQMRAFWRRYNELLTGEPARSEIEVYQRVARQSAA